MRNPHLNFVKNYNNLFNTKINVKYQFNIQY